LTIETKAQQVAQAMLDICWADARSKAAQADPTAPRLTPPVEWIGSPTLVYNAACAHLDSHPTYSDTLRVYIGSGATQVLHKSRGAWRIVLIQERIPEGDYRPSSLESRSRPLYSVPVPMEALPDIQTLINQVNEANNPIPPIMATLDDIISRLERLEAALTPSPQPSIPEVTLRQNPREALQALMDQGYLDEETSNDGE
jgi:hypothetical protein